jgi:3-dehydroquinate dehydratase-1
MICVSVDEQYDTNYLINLDKTYIVEVRMDRMMLSGEDIVEIFSRPAIFIATCRPGILSDLKRKEYLMAAIEAGAGYVDVEVESESDYMKEIIGKAREKSCKVIVSFHDYEKTPSERRLKDIILLCFAEGADIVKIACKANSIIDSARLLGLLGYEDYKGRLVVVGMGEKGRITRIVAPLLGSLFTYASHTEGRETAEGQIEKGRLENTMRLLNE